MAQNAVGSQRTSEYDEFLKLLRELREKTEFSQERLSRELDRPRTYVGKVELGTRRLDMVEFFEIVTKLGYDPVEVVKTYKTRIENRQ